MAGAVKKTFNPPVPLNWKRILSFTWPLLIIAALFGGRYLFLGKSQGSAGEKLYQQHCANCHMEQGQGLRGLIPPVANADYVAAHGGELACGIVNGYYDSMVVNGVTYRQPMPAIEGLSPYEITTLINYLKTEWGPQGEPVTFAEVEAALDSCQRQQK
jgi:mono/diheme cytochrome c family protein